MLLVREPDQESLQDTTARYLADRADARTVRSRRDHPDGFDADYWRSGVQLGWTHLLVSEDLGGGSVSGHGLVDLTLVAHEFGRRAAPGPLLVNAVVAGALSRAGGHDDVVKALLAGDVLATWAGPLGPTDADRPPAVQVQRHDGDVVLDGTVRPVESLGASTFALVTGATPTGPVQVLVPTDAPGCSTAPLRSVDLTRRFSRLSLDHVRLPATAVLDEPDTAAGAIDEQLRQALVIAVAESVGAMDAAFAMTLAWTADRYSFGRPLASYQALKHRMALMKTWLEASHAIADEAASAVAAGTPDASKLASAAAAYVGEYGSELLQECVQLHGGIGVTFEHDLHLFLRRHTLNRALHGTPAEHRRCVARELRAQTGPA